MKTLTYKTALWRYKKYLEVARKNTLWRTGIFVAFSLVLVLTMIWFALRPTLVTISSLIGQIRGLEEVEKKLDHKISALAEASRKLEEIRGDLYLLSEAVPENTLWDEWVEKLSLVASESGVRILTIELKQFTESRNGGGQKPEEMGFEMGISGQYEGLLGFISRLEGMRRIVVLSESRWMRTEAGELSIYIKGKIGYILKDEG